MSFFKVLTQDYSARSGNELTDLFRLKLDGVVFENCVSPAELQHIKKSIGAFDSEAIRCRIGNDGYVYPVPYSMVQPLFFNDPVQAYFDEALESRTQLGALLGQDVFDKISTSVKALSPQGVQEFPTYSGRAFSGLNLRVLYSGYNGIDIHCENVFAANIEDNFRKYLYDTVDLENCLSFFLVLQKPETGGETIVFNKNWVDTKMDSNSLSYEKRHDKSGHVFEEEGYDHIERVALDISEGSMFVFRAAQMWHTINRIQGLKNRITVGGFLGQSARGDGVVYYWA